MMVEGTYDATLTPGGYEDASVAVPPWMLQCDGSSITSVKSIYFGRFVPDVSDNRFLQGSTSAGVFSNQPTGVAADNTRDFTHDHDHSVGFSVAQTSSGIFEIPDHTHDVDILYSSSRVKQAAFAGASHRHTLSHTHGSDHGHTNVHSHSIAHVHPFVEYSTGPKRFIGRNSPATNGWGAFNDVIAQDGSGRPHTGIECAPTVDHGPSTQEWTTGGAAESNGIGSAPTEHSFTGNGSVANLDDSSHGIVAGGGNSSFSTMPITIGTQASVPSKTFASSSRLSGSGIPAGGLGVVWDTYLDTDNGNEYQKTGAATWTLVGNLWPSVSVPAQIPVKLFMTEDNTAATTYDVRPLYIQAKFYQRIY